MTLRRLLLILTAAAAGSGFFLNAERWTSAQAQTAAPVQTQGRQGGAPQAGRGGGAYLVTTGISAAKDSRAACTCCGVGSPDGLPTGPT